MTHDRVYLYSSSGIIYDADVTVHRSGRRDRFPSIETNEILFPAGETVCSLTLPTLG